MDNLTNPLCNPSFPCIRIRSPRRVLSYIPPSYHHLISFPIVKSVFSTNFVHYVLEDTEDNLVRTDIPCYRSGLYPVGLQSSQTFGAPRSSPI